MWRAGIYDHTEPGQAITATANSSGVAQGFLGPVPAGYVWYVERYTAFVGAARSNGVVEVYALTTNQLPSGYSATAGDRTGRQDASNFTVVNGASFAVSDNFNPVFLGEGYYLVVGYTGLTNQDVAQLSTQISVHSIVNYSQDRQTIKQEAESTDPHINGEDDAAEQTGIIEELEHATHALFSSSDKAV